MHCYQFLKCGYIIIWVLWNIYSPFIQKFNLNHEYYFYEVCINWGSGIKLKWGWNSDIWLLELSDSFMCDITLTIIVPTLNNDWRTWYRGPKGNHKCQSSYSAIIIMISFGEYANAELTSQSNGNWEICSNQWAMFGWNDNHFVWSRVY